MDMIMRKKIYKTILLLPFVAILCALSACQSDEQCLSHQEPVTYRLLLNVSVLGYDGAATRATAYAFADKAQLYVLFHQGAATISGTAVYDASADEWTVTPSQTLTETDESRCQLAFFLATGGVLGNAVSLTQQTRIYTDPEATYQFSDGLLTVQGQLSPTLGRIRFRGEVGQKCTVSGLAFTSSFDLRDHSFSLSPSKFTATCQADGYTPYYYCAFADADKRELIFELNAESGLRRTFGEGVLQSGTSGYLTIPTADSHEGWTLVNLGSGGEITFPTVGKPTVTNIRSTRASLAATVTSAGGGRLSQTGFAIATHTSPTLADRTIDRGTATALDASVSGLTPETTYYVRAYAVNEAGTTYSEETVFQTPEKNEDGNELDLDQWDTDENWGDSSASDVDLDRETYPTDENWN